MCDGYEVGMRKEDDGVVAKNRVSGKRKPWKVVSNAITYLVDLQSRWRVYSLQEMRWQLATLQEQPEGTTSEENSSRRLNQCMKA
jgi:hypothetical protein